MLLNLIYSYLVVGCLVATYISLLALKKRNKAHRDFVRKEVAGLPLWVVGLCLLLTFILTVLAWPWDVAYLLKGGKP